MAYSCMRSADVISLFTSVGSAALMPTPAAGSAGKPDCKRMARHMRLKQGAESTPAAAMGRSNPEHVMRATHKVTSSARAKDYFSARSGASKARAHEDELLLD